MRKNSLHNMPLFVFFVLPTTQCVKVLHYRDALRDSGTSVFSSYSSIILLIVHSMLSPLFIQGGTKHRDKLQEAVI